MLATTFLTRLPVSVPADADEQQLGASVALFPAAGLLVGLLAALSDLALRLVVTRQLIAPGVTHVAAPKLAAAATGALAALIANTLVTGGLHLDGLADMADGLYGASDRRRALEIMKDSRIGAMGVAWLCTDIAARLALVASLGYGSRFLWLSVSAVAGRLAQVVAVCFWPYARESGTGKPFNRYAGLRQLLCAALLATAILLIAASSHALFASGMWPWQAWGIAAKLLAALAISVGGGGFLASIVARRLGGLTGDVYGGVNEVTEVLFLLCGVVLW